MGGGLLSEFYDMNICSTKQFEWPEHISSNERSGDSGPVLLRFWLFLRRHEMEFALIFHFKNFKMYCKNEEAGLKCQPSRPPNPQGARAKRLSRLRPRGLKRGDG